MKDSSELVDHEVPEGCRICRCYCLVVRDGGRTYNAQFIPPKGAWGNFCVSQESLDRIKTLVPKRSFEVVPVAVIVLTRTNQAFTLELLKATLLEERLSFPLHFVTNLVISDVDPDSHFRWEPGTPPPAIPFVATTTSPAFVLSSGTRGA